MENPETHAAALENCCEVLAVRHGLTDYNAQRRLQGQLDVPLNDAGRQQCLECGVRLKNMLDDGQAPPIVAIYSSPLKRTHESAEIIRQTAGLRLDIVLDSRIQEWNAGVLQGHLLDDLPELFPKEWDAWNRSSYNRVRDFFLEVSRRHLGQRILVVTHGGVLDDLFRLVRNIPMHIKTNAPKLNAEIHIVKAHINKPSSVSSCSLQTDNNSSSSSSGSSSSSSSGSSTSAAAAAGAAAVSAAAADIITWEIVSWGKLAKSDSLLTGRADNTTPIDISVRNIEYA